MYQQTRGFSYRHFIVILLVFCSVNYAEQAHGEPVFNIARLYSENRAYNPQFYTFPAGNTYENGQATWAMYAFAKITGTPDNPVILNPTPSSPLISDYELLYTSNGASKAVFFNFAHATYGGPFDPPPAWEDQTYTFTVATTTETSDWEIPDGSLVQMEIPQNVSVSGFYSYPTYTWDPVPGADYYRIVISDIDAGTGLPIYSPLFTSSPITSVESFTYTGDPPEETTPYAVWVIAFKNHPLTEPRYENEFLNRSAYFTRYKINDCPFGGSDIDDSDLDGVVDCLDQCPGEDDTIDVNPADSEPDCLDAYTDEDGDNIRKGIDNCPDTHNPEQLDTNGDGIGDNCDPIVAQFSRAMLFSDNRRYDPEDFQFNASSPYYDGAAYWLMLGLAEIDYDAPTDFPYPVILSPITPSDTGVAIEYELQDWGEYGTSDHFHIGLFMDRVHQVYGGPFHPPGDSWDDTTYSFRVRDETYDWYIPGQGLQQLAIPEVMITRSYQPTISWQPLAGADFYRVMIYPLNDNGFLDSRNLLFASEAIPGDTYSYIYTGDIFKDGQEYAIWIQAHEKHPTAACRDDAMPCTINRSGLFIKHSYDISIVPCDIDGDKDVDMDDALKGLKVFSGFPVPGLDVPEGEAVDFQDTLCALQTVSGARQMETHLIDWDEDGFNEFSGDCDEQEPGINPGATDVCGDGIDNDCDDEIDNGCSETAATPAGSNINITVLEFDLVFDAVTSPGETTAEVMPTGPALPPGFLMADRYYDISTTALFTGSVQVCMNYDDTGLGAEQEAGLHIFHYDAGTSLWEDITAGSPDTTNNIICGNTTDFSPIALGFSSLVGNWTVSYDQFCDNYYEYAVTWEFFTNEIYPGITFRSGQSLGFWSSNGTSFLITYVTGFQIPGTISGNTISGSYTGGGGIQMCYVGSRQ